MGCTGSNNKEEFHLSYWSSNNSGEIEFSKSMINNWNTIHPQKQIHFQPVPQ